MQYLFLTFLRNMEARKRFALARVPITDELYTAVLGKGLRHLHLSRVETLNDVIHIYFYFFNLYQGRYNVIPNEICIDQQTLLGFDPLAVILDTFGSRKDRCLLH